MVKVCLVSCTYGALPNPLSVNADNSRPPYADLGIHIWGGKSFQGPERGWGELGYEERCELP